MALAYQSIGVVHGNLSISPLYVFRSTSTLRKSEEILGALSFSFVNFDALFKYVFIVLKASDNDEGGVLKKPQAFIRNTVTATGFLEATLGILGSLFCTTRWDHSNFKDIYNEDHQSYD